MAAQGRAEHSGDELVLGRSQHRRVCGKHLGRAGRDLMDWHAREPDIDALLAAKHADPFALLGPHAVRGGIVLRVFLPGAESVSALCNGQEWPLTARRPEGFFEGLISGAAMPIAYRLR